MTPHRLAAALALAFYVLPPQSAMAGTGAAPAAADDLSAEPAADPAASELYLEVSVNGARTGLVVPFQGGPKGLRTSVQGLRELGIDPQLLGVAGQDDFALDAVPGLSYTYDPANQSIDLKLGDALRRPLQLNARNVRASGAGSADPGILLNYDLYGQQGVGTRVAALNELRLFGPRGVLSSSGNAVLKGSGQRYIRYDTSWTWSDPVSLQSLQVGDFISPSLGWSRSLRMAGVVWRRNFDLRPDLLTYPLASMGGSAVVPSSVSLYVNGMQQYSTDVPGGPFVIDQVAGLNGAGQATVITRDALGRQVATTLPLYVDTRLLASGLSDFALAAGVLRRDYGLRSFRYERDPVLSASIRRGLSDALTLEAHTEAGPGLLNGGAGAMLRLGQAGGVLSGALAGSARRGGDPGGEAGGWGFSNMRRGALATLGYQYIAPRFGLDLQSSRATAGYADLGTGQGAPVIRVNDRASLNVNMGFAGSASASMVHYRTPGLAAVRLAALAWSRSLGRDTFLSLSAFQDLGRGDAARVNRGFSVTLSMSLGDRTSLSANSGRQGGVRATTLTATRAPDFDGGWGWGLQTSRNGAFDVSQAQVQYLGNAGQLSATTLRAGTTSSSSVGLSGSLVAMDGTLLAARHVGRGFALVSTGLPDIPVFNENRAIGHTGADGRLLVADLMPYTTNRIAIDPTNLPADMRLERTALAVVPLAGAGVVAGFPVERYRAATVIVHGADGKPLAAGTPVRLTGAPGNPLLLVGYDGVLFVDGLKQTMNETNELVVGEGAAACTLRFAYQPGAEGQLPVIGPLRCAPKEATP
jgi:outer membrane usher protein